MQAKNQRIMVKEFFIIPVQIIHCFEIYNIHADINKIYRLSKSFILKIPYPNIIIKTIIKYIFFVFCHHLDHLWSQTLKNKRKIIEIITLVLNEECISCMLVWLGIHYFSLDYAIMMFPKRQHI